MRGRRKIFDRPNETRSSRVKGRNRELIKKRNKAIICRYYFFVTFSKLRYEAIIEKLSGEFFLSEHRTIHILMSESEMISEMKTQNLGINDLKKLYPQSQWS